jgi:ribokinase
MSLLVVGALHLDVVVRATRLPRPDETVAGQSVDYVFGGKGGNQAVAAARMGAQVHFAGRAGSDAFGDMLRDTLAASRVDTTQLQRDSGPSGMSVAIVDAAGDYGAVIVSTANLNIDAGEIAIAKGTRLVLLQNEIPDLVNITIARKAKDAGAQVWLNAAPARALPVELVERIDLRIVNRVEAEFYEGDRVRQLTTLGPEGVDFEGRHFPGYTVDVVSSHGAGDMFVGALAAQVLAGRSVLEAISFAQAAAALHVAAQTKARASLCASDVEAFMGRQESR